LIAGMTVPMLRFSTDIVEAIIPVTIALAGLVYLASRPLEKVNQGLWVAAAAIAFAALLYQGIILAVRARPMRHSARRYHSHAHDHSVLRNSRRDAPGSGDDDRCKRH
jgi:hypothetical protein